MVLRHARELIMKKLGIIALVLMLGGMAFAGASELKEQIKGRWVMDEAATLEHFSNTEKARKLSKKELKVELNKLRSFIRGNDMEFLFLTNLLRVTNKGKTTPHSITINRASGKIIIFDSKTKSLRTHREIRFQITFISKDRISIDSSDSKDLDLYIWKHMPK